MPQITLPMAEEVDLMSETVDFEEFKKLSAISGLSIQQQKTEFEKLKRLLQRTEARCKECGEIKLMRRGQKSCDRCIAKQIIELHYQTNS